SPATTPPHTASPAALLPAGGTINTATGLNRGTPLPASGGPYSVTLSATNATGTGPTAPLNLTISENPPVITSANTASGTTGLAFSYQIVATNGVSLYGASGLPAGLAINTATGPISGPP